VTPRSAGYWIYQYKVTRIPVCGRCGEGMQKLEGMLGTDYTCQKCREALLRRDTYLNYLPEA
jgi:tRNA(Ile2) C34 agmatinyltransferase TiaS